MNEEQEFLVDAQRTWDEQRTGDPADYRPDPAIQRGIDQAMDEAGDVEPGSEEPGFMGLGGLSKSDIEAQKQDIARRAESVDPASV